MTRTQLRFANPKHFLIASALLPAIERPSEVLCEHSNSGFAQTLRGLRKDFTDQRGSLMERSAFIIAFAIRLMPSPRLEPKPVRTWSA